MLTAYDALVAGVFDRVGVPLLLVGDTSGQVVVGYRDTVPVTMDHLIPLVQAVVRGTSHSLVIGDLPFGAYQASPEAALSASVRHLQEGGAQAVKLGGTPSGRTSGDGTWQASRYPASHLAIRDMPGSCVGSHTGSHTRRPPR
jgi:ketopantoate hydroxymethyltransferase